MRQGKFAGDPPSHEFHVLLVTPARGIGEAVAEGGRLMVYTGGALQMQLEK